MQFLMLISADSLSATLATHRWNTTRDTGHNPGISSEQSVMEPKSNETHTRQRAKQSPHSQEVSAGTQRKPSQRRLVRYARQRSELPPGHGHNALHPQAPGERPSCPITLTSVLVADTHRKSVHFEAYQAAISWKARSAANTP